MEDMGLIAKLFTTSSKLHLASSCLEKVAGGEEIDPAGKEALSWAGRFLLEVDWSSQTPEHEYFGGGLSLQATSVRPTFYSCLFRIAPRLREAGLNSEKDLLTFLGLLYHNLLLPGAPGRGYKKLSPLESRLGSLLLHEIAESILVQLNNNGLPLPSTSLKDEWKPTTNDLVPTATL